MLVYMSLHIIPHINSFIRLQDSTVVWSLDPYVQAPDFSQNFL